MYSILNRVVYPAYGVAIISKEITKQINGDNVVFYELKFLNKDVKILIPKDSVISMGIRVLSKKEELAEIFDIFCEKIDSDWFEKVNALSWNRRSKEYQKKIKTGKISDLAVIYRDLKYIEKKKNLSFGEKTILAQAEFLIAEECSIIMNERSIEAVCKELKKICEECIHELESGKNPSRKFFEKSETEEGICL